MTRLPLGLVILWEAHLQVNRSPSVSAAGENVGGICGVGETMGGAQSCKSLSICAKGSLRDLPGSASRTSSLRNKRPSTQTKSINPRAQPLLQHTNTQDKRNVSALVAMFFVDVSLP